SLVVAILLMCLSQMREDEEVEQLGERMHAAVKIRTYGVGRIWSQRRYNAGVIAPTRGKLFGLGQGSIGTGRASDVEVGVRQNPAHPLAHPPPQQPHFHKNTCRIA